VVRVDSFNGERMVMTNLEIVLFFITTVLLIFISILLVEREKSEEELGEVLTLSTITARPPPCFEQDVYTTTEDNRELIVHVCPKGSRTWQSHSKQ